jgi:hypothetical protein
MRGEFIVQFFEEKPVTPTLRYLSFPKTARNLFVRPFFEKISSSRAALFKPPLLQKAVAALQPVRPHIGGTFLERGIALDVLAESDWD